MVLDLYIYIINQTNIVRKKLNLQEQEQEQEQEQKYDPLNVEGPPTVVEDWQAEIDIGPLYLYY